MEVVKFGSKAFCKDKEKMTIGRTPGECIGKRQDWKCVFRDRGSEPSMLLSSDKIPRNIPTTVILCLSLNILQTSILGPLQEFDK